MNLTDKAMIVKLTRRRWGAEKKDRSATQAVSTQYSADDKAIRVIKRLIDPYVLKKVRRAYRTLGRWTLSQTLPWDDTGNRLLPAKNYFNFSKKARKLEADCEAAVEELLQQYEGAKVEAVRMLGELFDSADYPSRDELREKFYIRIDVMPLPDENDFRVDLGEHEIETLKQRLTDTLNEKYDAAMMDLYKRVRDVVGKFAETMNNPDKDFRDSKMQNIAKLVELLPRLNLTSNGELDQIRRDIEKNLLGYEPEQLRNEPEKRVKAAEAADEILAKMSGYTGKKK